MKATLPLKVLISIMIFGVISSSSFLETQEMIMQRFRNSPVNEMFEVYHDIFGKTYEMNSEEGIQRMMNFAENVRVMNEMQTDFPSLQIDATTDLPHEMWRRINNLNEDVKKFSDAIKI
jgi:hypothetical protein